MRWMTLKLASLAVILLSAAAIVTSQPAEAAEEPIYSCCYSDCMEFCTEDNSFQYCHHKCNDDCQAC